MVYNMYDGFYIFGPTYVPETAKDDQGMDKTKEYLGEKKLVYKNTSGGETLNVDEANKVCEYTLSPKTPYSAHYVTEDGETDIIVEYTLDNYITVRGKIDGMQYENSGYFTYFGLDASKNSESTEKDSSTSQLSTLGSIQYLGVDIKPEKLTENVSFYEDGEEKTEKCNYVYNIKQKKCYTSDGGATWFYIKDEDGKKIKEIINCNSISGSDNEHFIINSDAWRIVLEYFGGIIVKHYATLTGEAYTDVLTDLYRQDEDGKWVSGSNGINDSAGSNGELDTPINFEDATGIKDITCDFSAINYYIKAKVFSDEISSKLGNKKLQICKLEYNSDEGTYEYKQEEVENIFKLEKNNNPESIKSKFYKHKNEIITDLINSSINSTIASYSKNSGIDRNIPKISYDDMNNAIGNLSIFAFLIDLPMGYKTYNDYSYATSNVNNDFVNLKSLKYVINNSDNAYSHYIYCNELGEDDELTAYMNFEFLRGMHGDKLECYKCIINRGIMEEIETPDEDDEESKKEKRYNEAYLRALGRERYRQQETAPSINTSWETPEFDETEIPTDQTEETPSVDVPINEGGGVNGGGSFDPPCVE